MVRLSEESSKGGVILIPDKIKLALDGRLALADFHCRLAESRENRIICKLHEPLLY